jgi:hypothetical protein
MGVKLDNAVLATDAVYEADLNRNNAWILNTSRGWMELSEASSGKIHVEVWRSNFKQDDLSTELSESETFDDAEEAVEWSLNVKQSEDNGWDM